MLALILAIAVAQAPLPGAIQRQLPAGYTVRTSASTAPDRAHLFYFVALTARNEARRPAPPRPLLIFQQRPNGGYTLAARNDAVILRADQGGYNRCDPFQGLSAKGSYVTVENSVACGDHWTDYITFRFDARTQGFVFDNRRTQSWRMNPSERPDAPALLSDGVHVERAGRRSVSFAVWRRKDAR